MQSTRIELSTKKIGKLYSNLEVSIKNEPIELKEIDIKRVIKEKIEYYSYLYPDIEFKTEIKVDTLKSSQSELLRITR